MGRKNNYILTCYGGLNYNLPRQKKINYLMNSCQLITLIKNISSILLFFLLNAHGFQRM